MKNICLVVVLGLFSTVFAHAQGHLIDKQVADLKAAYSLPELTKAQMYADFDTLISIVKDCNPQIGVIKKVTGYDIIEALQTMKMEINEVQNITEYITLLSKALHAVLEGHAAIGYSVWYYRYAHCKEDVEYHHISDYDFSTTFKYIDSLRKYYPATIYLCYSNGDYLLKYKTVFYHNSDSLVLEQGTPLIAINGMPLIDYLANERLKNTGWDFVNRRFFNTNLFLSNPLNNLTFKQQDRLYSYTFSSLKDEENIIWRQSIKSPSIKWLEHDSILFIRLPAMQVSYIPDLSKSILAYKNYPVKSVIVDIRGNSGGSDKVWRSLLGHLSDTMIIASGTMLVNDNDRMRKRQYALHKPRKYNILDSTHYFDVVEELPDTIPALSENIGYRGNIYLITDADIFSSSQAVASLATPTSRIKTVGVPTGKIGGRAMNPAVFILPNSRFIFTLLITLDASNVQKLEDFYHEVLYPFYPSHNYYKYWYDKDRPMDVDEKIMYQYDELFIETLNVIDEERAKK